MLRAVCETYHSMNFSSCYYTQNKAKSLTFHLLHHCYNPNHFHLLTKIILSSATNVILKHKYYQGALLFKNFEMIPFTLTVKKKNSSLAFYDLTHLPLDLLSYYSPLFPTESQLCFPACC